jgi:hypothetical protein
MNGRGMQPVGYCHQVSGASCYSLALCHELLLAMLINIAVEVK